ncbi:MAG: hypothetical protein KJ606_07855 [Chloroflexi bacterium]|nr:hypothetical protein [Chloroflexota bacterium]
MVEYITRTNFIQGLRQSPNDSADAVIIVTGAITPFDFDEIQQCLDESVRVLRNGGLLFVQGYPTYLPELGVYLDQRLTFKYWIAIKSLEQRNTRGLPSVHAAVLLFTKGNGNFQINRVRFPHGYCSHCRKTLRDWGGKAHLMDPEGFAASDVWTSLPLEDNYAQLSGPALSAIIKMVVGNKIIVGPSEGVKTSQTSIGEPTYQYYLPYFGPKTNYPKESQILEDNLWNIVHHGDAIEILKRYPDNSVDLVFADPPYNLSKGYSVYNDTQSRDEYLAWCNSWLEEYIRILKPTGALYLLNLPHWTMYHATYLNKRLYFKNWIVWDALSEPRGKIMPAHYGLLFYTKHPTNFMFNQEKLKEIDSRQYCLRASCIRERKVLGDDKKDPLTDIWSDIHRLKHRRDRDYHPCQLPDALMERIIRLSTNEGDVVLDALAGTGTTAIIAKRLGRRYVAIDIDETYVRITQEKLEQVEDLGYVQRQSIKRPRPRYSKKSLQLELQSIAAKLGRLPTHEDVQKMSLYSLDAYLETFPTWGKALKAAKMEVRRNGNTGA